MDTLNRGMPKSHEHVSLKMKQGLFDSDVPMCWQVIGHTTALTVCLCLDMSLHENYWLDYNLNVLLGQVSEITRCVSN